MTEQKTKVGNVKSAIGLPTDKTIDQVYIPKSDISTDLDSATDNTKVAGAKAVKDAIDDKADALDIPTKTSDLTNDSGFITNADIPTKTSDLTNDSGFITQHQDISGKEDTTNKVTSWNSPTTNAHYPSEKLVKDSLDDKISKSSTTGLVKNDGTIDTTTYLTQHQDITGKEDNTNKVTSWNDTPNNTRYPSEKLVKDSLDQKISKSNTQGLVKNDGTIDTTQYLTSADITDKIEISVLASADDLPATGQSNVFYFVPSSSSESQNAYDEYVWVNGAYEKVGVQKVDLTGYVKTSELKDHISGEITATGDLNLIFTY